jgi:hypothetical protein
VYVPGDQVQSGEVYNLYRGTAAGGTDEYRTRASVTGLRNALVEIRLDGRGHVKGVYRDGVEELLEESFLPVINYDGKKYGPGKLSVRVDKDGRAGVAAVRLSGELALPVDGAAPGKIEYLLYLIEGVPHVFIDAAITYPDTPRTTVFKPGVPALARLYDPAWREVAPCELNFARAADKKSPFRVLKRNFLGIESSYSIDYFKHSRKNLDLANVNNHITSEYVAVTGKQRGIAVAMDTTLRSNFAFCPLKVDYGWWSGFRLKMNPFGTYFGEQYYQPTWGKRQGYTVALLTGDQYHTAACTFSGYTTRFSLMVCFFKGDAIPAKEKQALISYARPPFAVWLGECSPPAEKLEIAAPKGFLALYGDNGIYFHWEKPAGEVKGYRVYCGTMPGSNAQKYSQAGSESTLFVKEFSKGVRFKEGDAYYASIAAVDASGREGPRSAEIRFTVEAYKKEDMNLPITLQLRILWATVLSLVD